MSHLHRVSILCLVLIGISTASGSDSSPVPPRDLFFIANEGQWEVEEKSEIGNEKLEKDGGKPAILFKMANGGTTWWVTSSGMTLDMRQMERTGNAKTGGLRRLNPPLPANRLDREVDEPQIVRGHVLRMNFIEANPNPHHEGQDKLSSYSNYFIGRDKCRWKSFVGHYQKVFAVEVWQGIDVEYKAQPEGVEILYHVKPHTNPNQIILEYEGLDAPLRIDSEGNLILQTSLGEVKEKAPFAYQIESNRQVQIPVRFKLLSDNRYGLQCEAYDAEKELVIDPLLYSTYFGAGDGIRHIDRDPQGNLVVAGNTGSETFPITPGAYQTTLPHNSSTGFISKLTSNGRELVFSTYLGGLRGGGLCCCVVDDQGAVYVGGSALSSDWPLTNNALDTVFAGINEGFFSKLSFDGSRLEYSSFFGGGGQDYVTDLAQDEQSGEIYVCGVTNQPTTGFPITTDALFPTSLGTSSFISIFFPVDNILAYSTFFPSTQSNGGPEAHTIIPMGNGQVWISGFVWNDRLLTTEDAFQNTYGGGDQDGFFALLDLENSQLTYSSYIGGGLDDGCLTVIPVSTNRVILSGYTRSANFPVTTNAFDTSFQGFRDGFITIVQIPDSIIHSTFLGGDGDQGISAVLINPDETMILFGYTSSTDFPTTSDGYDTVYHNNPEYPIDGYICKLSADLSELEYGTYLAGWRHDYIECGLLDGQDSIWVAGNTLSGDYPVTSDAFQTQQQGWASNFISHLYIGHDTNAVTQQKPLPTDFSLSVYPNPFNPTTTISFSLPRASEVQIAVYDVLGRNVGIALPCAATMNTKNVTAGEHHVVFDGSELASGVYFVRVEAGGISRTRKLLLLR